MDNVVRLQPNLADLEMPPEGEPEGQDAEPGPARHKTRYKPPLSAEDWTEIHKEYRAGQLPIAVIAKRFGCSDTAIRKRADRDGWTRDLAEQVRRKAHEKAVRLAAGAVNAYSDAEVVAIAADRGAAVLTRQQQRIESMVELGLKLRESLTRLAEGVADERDARTLGKIAGVVDAYNALSNATHRLVQLERQAHNLDTLDEGGQKGPALAFTFDIGERPKPERAPK